MKIEGTVEELLGVFGARSVTDGQLLGSINERIQEMNGEIQELKTLLTKEHDDFVNIETANQAALAAKDAANAALNAKVQDLVAALPHDGDVTVPQAEWAALKQLAANVVSAPSVAVDAGPTVDQSTVDQTTTGTAPAVNSVLETAPVTVGADTTTAVDPATSGTVIDTSTADQTAANPVSNSSPVDGAVTDSTVGAVPVVNANLVDPNQPA